MECDPYACVPLCMCLTVLQQPSLAAVTVALKVFIVLCVCLG